MINLEESEYATRIEYTVTNDLLYQEQHYLSRSNNPYSVKVCLGDTVRTIETDSEVILYEFDTTTNQFVERERMTKVVDNPDTEEDESQTFWQTVASRLMFWRDSK